MFTVYIGSLLTTVLFIQALFGKGEAPASFILAITFGFGLLYYLLILQKPWQKVVVKHKHKHYVKHAVKFKQKN